MKSFVARTTLLGLSFVASMASANTYQSLDTIQVEASKVKSALYKSASATLNYGKDTLDLALQPPTPVCPAGRMCTAVVPNPDTFSFESVNSTVDSCGVVTSIAVKDERPVDGIRTEVKLVDASKTRCSGYKPAPGDTGADLIVTQKWYDRLNGGEAQTSHQFKITSVTTVVAFQGVIRADLQSVSSDDYKSANLFLDGGKGLVDLTLCVKAKNCSPQSGKTLSFDNARTEINDCGIIQTVATKGRPGRGKFVKVTINNNRNNTCPTFAPLAALDVIVEQTSGREGLETIHTFDAEDFALIKPATK